MLLGLFGQKHFRDSEAALPDIDITDFTVGRYEVEVELGRGPVGVVYKGRDPETHRPVAIKTWRLSRFDKDISGEGRERFFRDVESAWSLIHPNIVAIYDCGEEHDLAYVAMEYLEGDNMEQYTRAEHLLPIRDTLNITAFVADALAYAHGRDVVHQDIKPANIIRNRESRSVKVTDFGMVQTPFYMSPEQVSGKKVDGRSDIFSLGMVLFEMLAGEKPFVGKDITSLMFKIAKEKHPSVRDINPGIPRIVEKIIDKALEKNLEKRYQKAAQMAAHLKKVVAGIDEIQAQ